MNYAQRHAALVTYMQAKIEEKDWHGVSDAANDLREIEAEKRSQQSSYIIPNGIVTSDEVNRAPQEQLKVKTAHARCLLDNITLLQEQLAEAIKWARAGHNTICRHQNESAWPIPKCSSCKEMLLDWPEHLRAGASTHV